jgi:hypothetical protein
MVQNSACSYTKHKRQLSVTIGLGVLLYGSKRRRGNGTEMGICKYPTVPSLAVPFSHAFSSYTVPPHLSSAYFRAFSLQSGLKSVKIFITAIWVLANSTNR